MNIYLISFGDFDYDGRLRSLIEVISQIGEIYSFSKGGKATEYHTVYTGNYINFINAAIKQGKILKKRVKKIDILFIDNRKAIIPGLILKNILCPQYVIKDCRELYLINEVKGLISKIGCILEKLSIQSSNIVICANKERSYLMKKIYNLKDFPIVYENLRQLHYENDEEKYKAKAHMSKYIFKDEYRIISTSGCSTSRLCDILVMGMSKVHYKCRLILIGESKDSDKKAIDDLIYKNKLSNITILGKLNQNELKYLIDNSHIGVVSYNQIDTNNKYCASGKLYEFIYEDIPVVTTTNPSLKHICDTEHIGEADDFFYNGICKILDNYNFYVENVKRFKIKNTIADNDRKLKRAILKYISNKSY